jgi:probable phosphoglycerate mutase
LLILVRHGQTAANAAGLLLGRADLPLTDFGRRQAEALAAALGRTDRIVSSPLLRARDTAEAIAVASGASVTVDERWAEVDYGEYDELPFHAVGDDVWHRWRTDPTFRPPGGETFEEVDERVRLACGALVDAAADSNVVVVSHVSPIKSAVAWALGVDGSIAWRMHLDVAAITRVRVARRSTTLISFNEIGHLAALAHLPR